MDPDKIGTDKNPEVLVPEKRTPLAKLRRAASVAGDVPGWMGHAASRWWRASGSQLEHAVVSWGGESMALVGVVVATVGQPTISRIAVGVAMIVVGGFFARSERIRDGVRLFRRERDQQRRLRETQEQIRELWMSLQFRLRERNESARVDENTIVLVRDLLEMKMWSADVSQLLAQTLHNFVQHNPSNLARLQSTIKTANMPLEMSTLMVEALLAIDGIDAQSQIVADIMSDLDPRLRDSVNDGYVGIEACRALLFEHSGLPNSNTIAQTISLFDEQARSVALAKAAGNKREAGDAG
jgi:hypothetical protein